MSYILEALKKAEQKRQREETPGLVTFLVESPHERKKKPVWPYILLAVLILNVAAVVWWIAPWQTVKEETAAKPHSVNQTAPAVTAEDRQINQNVTDNKKASLHAKYIEKPQDIAQERPSAEQQKRVEKKPVIIPADKVFSLKELPADIKSALPVFKISGHAYSPEPQTRVVRVNDKILQEGQELSPGIKIEEIIQAGIILSYQGYRFRIGVGENR
jgi:general secretion pathway protein B